MLLTRNDKTRALKEAFYRSNLPNILNLVSTVAVFVVVIYLQGFRVEIPIKSTKIRGQQGSYPIKLFYTSNMPIIIQNSIVSYICTISQFAYNRFANSAIVRLLGVWEPHQTSGHMSPVAGLSYYITSPYQASDILKDPLQFIIYFIFILSSSAFLSKAWIEFSGTSPKDVAKQMRDQNMIMRGHREGSMYKELKRIIPTAAALGGLTIGAISISADLLGKNFLF